ncbi:ATP-dependent DNA helicase [Caenorhabditis elegans]|uniref:ATP-dependent DNA helicase n=1 Tax=Caenorhabditis elegans TaxID=6239 RepID=O02243_CAEEL|nr:ATP-dependent DNA helicase [Caenorhabditis elegans]CAB04087.2 ATP-dependent DNA helicase [Caenorhabditis elegans]|eukprot:NP_493597.2 ATP-dependent DNA helicase [Caenorhabditis elegans]
MPCPHCPQEEIEAVLAVKMSQSSFEEFPVSNEADNTEHAMEVIPTLNQFQQPIALEIVNNWKMQKLHYIEGISGTGKTYLLNAICGLFKNFSLNIEIISPCPFPREHKSILKILSNHDVFLEEIDKLKRAMQNDKPFGGKAIVMAADFGQLLPFSLNFNQKVKNSLKHLAENLVAPFKKHVLPTPTDDWSQFMYMVRQTPKIVIPDANVVSSLDELIDFTFGPLYTEIPNLNGIILTPKKADVEYINLKIMDQIKGKDLVFEAKLNTRIIRSDLSLHSMTLSFEFLYARLSFSVDSKHEKGCIVALDEPFEGLQKGTRLLFEDLNGNHLCCKVIETGKDVDISRVKRLIGSSGKSNNTQQSVLQFPVSLNFASTIHGSQGKSFEKLGLYKLNECFEHGMIYTAISRVRRFEDYKVFTEDTVIENKIEQSLL